MHKIFIIFKREYLTRIRNKSFIIMTLLGPILITAFYAGIVLVAMQNKTDTSKKIVKVTDVSHFFNGKIDTFQGYHFVFGDESESIIKKEIAENKIYSHLQINDHDIAKIDSAKWFSKKDFSIAQKDELQNYLAKSVYDAKLAKMGFKQSQIDSLKPKIVINDIAIDDNGKEKISAIGVKTLIGFALAFVIYIFIFIYGSMVMRGALEEKTNRIVEVVVSSIKPFQLMMGKVLGVAAVGLTQFIAWIVLGLLLSSITFAAIGVSKSDAIKARVETSGVKKQDIEKIENSIPTKMMESIKAVPLTKVIVAFIFFFFGGFLLYGSFFAAIGSAVNQDTEVQQFMLPISLPLIFGLVIAQSSVFQNPNGQLATIFSYIPFTSPIVMMVRTPFIQGWWPLIISLLILIVTFIFFIWLSARIYRIGILMYGKKPSWKDLLKWVVSK